MGNGNMRTNTNRHKDTRPPTHTHPHTHKPLARGGFILSTCVFRAGLPLSLALFLGAMSFEETSDEEFYFNS